MNYCNKCGKKIAQNDIICQNCGNIFKNNSEYNEQILEKLRKKTLTKYIILYIALVVLAVVIFICYFVTFKDYNSNIRLLVLITFCTISMGTFLSRNFSKKYKKYYKNIVVSTILKKYFDDILYQHDKGLDAELIKNTNMMRMGNIYNSNDYIEAKYKNVIFKSADVVMCKKDDDENKVLFRGQWMIFEFNKNFKSVVQVYEKSFQNSISPTLKRVILENENFNNRFRVYSKDSADAFYILTPQNMEKIQELNAKIPGALLLGFINNRLHIGLCNNKDLFEPSLFRKINLDNDSKKITNQLEIITSFIDILDLENDLFRREV